MTCGRAFYTPGEKFNHIVKCHTKDGYLPDMDDYFNEALKQYVERINVPV
jgi:hypothetical protein